MSSSIPSWQILTAHAQTFRGATDLAFCLKVPLDSLLVWASSEGSGETARMRRLAWTFAARIGDKYQIRLTRSKCSTEGFFFRSTLFKIFWVCNYLVHMSCHGPDIVCKYLSHFMRKPVLAICEQQRRRSACANLISTFVISCLDSIIPLVSISKISSLYLASVAAQAGLGLPWSQTPKTDFLVTRLN